MVEGMIAHEEWELMTVGRLLQCLEELIVDGHIELGSYVYVDSDPEGNGINPLRQFVSVLPIANGRIDYSADVVTLPAKAVWFGVGYDGETN